MKITLISCVSALILLGMSSCISATSTPPSQKIVPETYVNVDGAQLFCRVVGKGKPLIVIHGGPGLTQDYLLPSMYALAENNTVIFYDQRASGRSTGDINADTMTFAKFVEDLDAIRKAFNLDKVSILGHSFGGFIAMNYAIAHPDHVENLILMNSLPPSSEEIQLFVQAVANRFAPIQTELDELLTSEDYLSGNPQVVEKVIRLYFQKYCYDPDKADLLDVSFTQKTAQNCVKINNVLWAAILSNPFNLHAALQKLPTRTLIVHGDFDIVPPMTAENVHKSIPNSQLFLMDECGHFPFVEKPQELFEVLHNFLNAEGFAPLQ